MSPAEALQAYLERTPYARFLGVRAELAGDEMTAILPYSDHLIGNPTLPALHGGVLGAFMEMTAVAQLSIAQSLFLHFKEAIYHETPGPSPLPSAPPLVASPPLASDPPPRPSEEAPAEREA